VNRWKFGELEVAEDGTGITVGVPGEPIRVLEPTPEAVAAFVRHGDDGRYRPLSGAKTLPHGWEVTVTDQFPLDVAFEAVYPLSTVHQRLFAEGRLEIVPLEAVLARQSGRYESSSMLSSQGRELAVAILCGECVRTPVWAGADCPAGGIPCPEPCSVMVSLCREAAFWEANPPAPAPVDATVAFAAFDEPGNQLRERYLSEMIDIHD
jgi:sirohydrochlorin cobaltochelatase